LQTTSQVAKRILKGNEKGLPASREAKISLQEAKRKEKDQGGGRKEVCMR
jgi:hypothetical protein